MYPKCQKCKTDMRPRGTYAADHPGTHVAHNSEICSSCYQRGDKAGEAKDMAQAYDPLPDEVLQRMEAIAASTAKYIKSRREGPNPVPARGLNRVTPIGLGRPAKRSLSHV